MALEDVCDRARPEVPDEHAPVARHRCAEVLVDEDEVLDVVRMPAQDELGASIREIPDDGRVVGRRRRGAASPSSTTTRFTSAGGTRAARRSRS